MMLLLVKKFIDVYGLNKEEVFFEVYKYLLFKDKRLVDCFLDIIVNDGKCLLFSYFFLYMVFVSMGIIFW